MDTLKNYILQAHEQNANELLLVPNSPAHMRVGLELKNISDKKLNPEVLNQQLLTLLSDEQQKELTAYKHVHGAFKVDQTQYKISIDLLSQGMAASIEWQDIEDLNNEKWEFHPNLVDSMDRLKGLVVVAGSQKSGKTSALHSILWKCFTLHKKSIAFFSDSSSWSLPAGRSVATYYDSNVLQSKAAVARYADIIVIDSEDISCAHQALQFAEMGKLVLFTVSAVDWFRALERFAEECSEKKNIGYANYWRRLTQVLTSAMTLQRVKSADQGAHGLYELLMLDANLKAHLFAKDIAQIRDVMSTTGDKTAMRTMNQALVQAILRRKIDIRTAFDSSPDPAELDKTLKKLGI